MTPAHEALLNLCSALGIDLRGLGDDTCELIALRIVAEGILPTKPNIERIIADVKLSALQSLATTIREEIRRAEGAAFKSQGGALAPGSDTRAPSAHPFRFHATEADAIQRRELAARHQAETSRSGLYLVPRRPQALPVDKPHPACLSAARDGGTPCSRCAWLLDEDPYTEAWLDG